MIRADANYILPKSPLDPLTTKTLTERVAQKEGVITVRDVRAKV